MRKRTTGKGLPPNLYYSVKKGAKSTFRYKDPITKKTSGIKGTKAACIRYAINRNEICNNILSVAKLNLLECKAESQTGVLNKAEVLDSASPCRKLTGIYFLISKEEIVYVGQSINILSRIGQHLHHKPDQFDSFSFVEIDRARLSNAEALYIQQFQPALNKDMPTPRVNNVHGFPRTFKAS